MDIFQLPLEIVERILLCLDVQDLAACSVADLQFAEIIYSNHFLDDYCRSCFDCALLNISDITSADVSEIFEFWHLVYVTMKVKKLILSVNRIKMLCLSATLFEPEGLYIFVNFYDKSVILGD